MLSGVSTIYFAAGYAVALALEISRLWFRSRVRRLFRLGFAGAGLVAHTAFLYYSAISPAEFGAPLSSQRDWFLVAAWGLVAVYLYFTVLYSKAPFDLFLLPLALALIGTARFLADAAPLGREPASKIWGAIHGVSIVLATVAVLVGFVAGLMYLGQVRHLKHKIETVRFMGEMYHRAIGPVIERLRLGWQRPKEEELQRLLNKLPELDPRAREEIRRSFDRLTNKLLHPPLESLRDESREGVPHGLLDALKRLFQLKD